MFSVGGLLIYLAVRKGYEPLLLIPIGFGTVLANLPARCSRFRTARSRATAAPSRRCCSSSTTPASGPSSSPGDFLGVGALTDFRPLLARPITFLLGAAAPARRVRRRHGGRTCSSASPRASRRRSGSSPAVRTAPRRSYLTSLLAPHLLGPVAVAAYSYMSLVPIIQPPVAAPADDEGRAGDRHAPGEARLAGGGRRLPGRHRGGRRPRACPRAAPSSAS